MQTPSDMKKSSSKKMTIHGEAALAICESMLIALSELKIFSAQDARDILVDAASTHRGAGSVGVQGARHETIALMIERVRTSGNSVPR